MMLHLNRRTVFAMFAAVAMATPCAAATPRQGESGRDPAAEAFVESGTRRVLGVLADRSLTEAEKEAAFHHAIDNLADTARVTTFVLGKYARSITPGQRAQFASVFRTYAESVYRNRLNQYHGETVRITGSIVRKPGDVIVATQVAGGHLAQPEAIASRVMNTSAGWRVVDVQFKGVWLAITQQQDFVSTVDNAHGDINVLIARLQRDIQASQRAAPR
jgi:phospholipid transport system substrate-binding protein